MHFVPDVAGPTGKAAFLELIAKRLKPGSAFYIVMHLWTQLLTHALKRSLHPLDNMTGRCVR